LAALGLAALFFLILPSSVGVQDLGAWIVQHGDRADRPREPLIASPFGTIHAATFSLPQPLGTFIPTPPAFERVNFASADPDMTGALPRRFHEDAERAARVYPTVNRALKGDRLVPGAKPPAAPAAKPEPTAVAPAGEIVLQVKPADDIPLIVRQEARRGPPPRREVEDLEAAARFEPFPEFDIALSLEMSPQVPGPGQDEPDTETTTVDTAPERELARMYTVGRIYFDGGSMGAAVGKVEPWAPDEAPIVMLPRAPTVAEANTDTASPKEPARALSLSDKSKAERDAVTVAGKGEVTAEAARPKSPAERLGLSLKARAKAEKCLANAVYFESRSEPVRGQIAVAQVVINRAFSGYYPDDICGVVYQNAHRHLSCQFTFACDGIPDIVTEPEQWERAKRIAHLTLDGKLWVKEVGKATHYHASYVYPYWVRSMRRLSKIGLHSFYRPRKWGDGSDEPSWPHAAVTADAAAKL
jgi:spore germination cell wall hydrolase CwlJ-like protein